MNPADRLIRKLQSVTELSEAERHAIRQLPIDVRTIGADVDIVQHGDRPTHACLIVEGFACRYSVMQDGKRQIMSFHNPGDLPDLQSLHLKVMDHSFGTLTRCEVGLIPHEALHELCGKHPRIAAVLWRDTLIDAAIFREWIVNVGRRSAYKRLAHLLCEVFTRLKAVGLAEGDRFALPITQAELADATGLSTVHVNRTIQELRAAGLIVMEEGYVTVEDGAGLRAAADFDPTYLHLVDKQAA